jgi:heme exporter protein A
MWRGERCLFRDLALQVHAARALHVRGPNGCGKTTLLRILCGLLTPDDGQLLVDGERVRGADPRLRSLVGYLGHADGLKLELGVAENLRFAAALTAAAVLPDAGATLARMDLSPLAGLQTRHLSAGQRRRLAIGRLIGGGHRVWVLDEPFTALDSAGGELLGALLEQALDAGVGVVFTSHLSAPLRAARLDVLDLPAAAA